MATAPPITDTPTGFTSVSPWTSLDSTLVVDLKASLANDRMMRNVLSTRIGARSAQKVHSEQSFTLPAVTSGPNSTLTANLHSGAVACIISSNRPVQISVTNGSGTLILGLASLFVFTGNLNSVTITNTENDGTAEVNLIFI